jgi:hypothetical protein
MSLIGIMGANEHREYKGKGTLRCREEKCSLIKGSNEINL